MKSKPTDLALIVILALSCSFHLSASIPVDFDDMKKLYGPPDKRGTMMGAAQWTVDGMTVTFEGGPSGRIQYTRDTPFSPLEIANILRPLSVEEEWVQQGPKDWILPNAKAKAHWDGESKIIVTSTDTSAGGARRL